MVFQNEGSAETRARLGNRSGDRSFSLSHAMRRVRACIIYIGAGLE